MSAPSSGSVITERNSVNGSANNRGPLLTVALGAACISASGILITLAGTGPATTAFYRCLLASLVLVPLLILEQRRRGPRRPAAHLGAVLAGLFLAVDFVLWNHAITALGAGISTVLGNLQVVFVALAAWLLFGERPQRRFVIALPIVMIGVILVSGLIGTATHGIQPVAGIEYGLGTSIAYAAFILVLRRTSAATPHVAGPLAEATASAGVFALLIGLMFGGMQFHISWAAFGWLLFLAMSSQTVGWLLITSALPRLPAAITSMLLLLQPAAAMLLAAVVLNERPSLTQIGGAVALCGGVLIASLSASGTPAELAAPVEPGPDGAAGAGVRDHEAERGWVRS